MTELSKTARASQVKEIKEVRIETTEEAIRQIRLNLEAKLYITPDRITKLLAAYDKLLSETKELAKDAVGLISAIIPEVIVPMGSLKPGVPPADFDASHIQMKEAAFDHPHEDEHHLVDFGHHTVHKTDAGA